jgi:formyl-CoA transferase
VNAPPLHDIRVVEAGQLLAGPYCGQLLADFGAEVVKLEPPGVGDPLREWGREKAGGHSLWWPIVARGKKSVTLDLRSEEGAAIAREMLASADVLVENFRPGTLERWGLGPETLHELNPRLVITRVTGYGQTGPYSGRPGYGSIGEAVGGLRYVTGDPGSPPSRMGISIGDTLAAMFACIGTLCALHARRTTGRGQVVDAAIYEAVLAVMESLIPDYAITGYVRERTGSVIPNVAPSNAYPTRDEGLMLIAANQDRVFRRLAAAMGEPELADDPRYSTHGARGSNQVELDERIAAWSSTLDRQDIEDTLDANGVPFGRIYTAADMLEDPHFAARQAILRLVHPDLGDFPMQNVFPRLSETPGSVRGLGPELGAHTDEVLREWLGRDDEELARLHETGIT